MESESYRGKNDEKNDQLCVGFSFFFSFIHSVRDTVLSSRLFWCVIIFCYLLVPLLSILMIFLGFKNSDSCSNMIPVWLSVMGITILTLSLISLLFFSGFCCTMQEDGLSSFQSVLSWFFSAPLIFGLVWFCLGCYWTGHGPVSMF